MKILVVEDERPTAEFLRRGLSEEGFAVDVARTALAADEAICFNTYDAIVLDVMLPEGGNLDGPGSMAAPKPWDGFALCDRWRRRGVSTPILFLSARDQVSDRVEGFERGGDDYLIKPFAFQELVVRVRALIRRRAAEPIPPEIRIRDIVIDTNRRRVLRQGRPIVLTAREYQLLEYLAHRPDRPVTRTELWEHVWESGGEPDSNVVDVYIGYLRRKLGPDSISTMRGAGYILRSETAD